MIGELRKEFIKELHDALFWEKCKRWKSEVKEIR